MARTDEATRMEQRARRCVALLLYLLEHGSSSASEVVENIEEYLYFEDKETAVKAVLRDAEELAGMGVQVSDVGPRGRVLSAGASTVADLKQLKSPADTARLAVMLSALASDRGFMQADDLRRALAKIVGPVSGDQSPLPSVNAGQRERFLRLIEARAVSTLRYCDARGKESVRVVQPSGLFELNGHVYLVANTLEVDGEPLAGPGAMRTYRDDRILGLGAANAAVARVWGKTFELAEDFNAGDWCVLPFQIGPSLGPVEFAFDDTRKRDVEARLPLVRNHDWSLLRASDGLWRLRVGVCCSWEDAARWAIGMGIVPLGPSEVVESRAALLAQARSGLLSLTPLVNDEVELKDRSLPGRPLSAPVMVQLITLLGLFSEPGVDVSAAEIAQTLGVSLRRARQLVDLLCQTSLSFGYLPIDEGTVPDTWHLSEWSSFQAARLRLSRREAAAVDAAIETYGLKDYLGEGYERLRAAFWPAEQEGLGHAAAFSSSAPGWAPNLLAVVDAIRDERILRFSYQGIHDEAPHLRNALPRSLFSRNGIPYVSAFDLARHEVRRFHLGRMTGLVSEESTPGERAAASRAETDEWLGDAHRVHVLLADPRATSFFNWEGMVELEYPDPQAHLVVVPDLGGDWLARHVVAFADVAKTDDFSLSRRIAAYARSCLEQD